MKLSNKTILITGASTGIGRELAAELMGRKNKLILIARRKELIDELISETRASSENVLAIKCDVSKKSDVDNAFEAMIKNFGLPDVAILNSAIVDNLQVDNYNSESAEIIFGINFLGVVHWIEKLLPQFRDRDSGTIVAVSSIADNRGYSGAGFYSPMKAALTNHLEGLSASLKDTGVQIVTIRPGFVRTPMIEKRKSTPLVISPKRAIKEIIKGLEKEKRYIEFPRIPAILHKIVKMVPGKFAERFL